VRPDHQPRPGTILGELLTSHPEAASLLAEASHCRALAVYSMATAKLKFDAAQAARLAYEELRHRLEPRRSHPIHFTVGLLLLLVLGAGLAMLNVVELSALFGGLRSVLPALAATAVWLTVAWLAATAVRQRRPALVAHVVGAALLLGLLLVALHGLGPRPGWPAGSGPAHGSMVFGALTGVFILVLTAGATALMTHMEPASLLVARSRWHRARTAYEEAVETERADAQAAAVATEAWLALVRARVTAIATVEERLVEDTVALAAAILESARIQLPPAE
jgi:hypothetical protein